MAALALDITGTSSANLITNERHDVSSKTKRIFVPNKGAFFGKGLIIRDASTNKILQPMTGYKILHMVREAVIETKKEVYAVIMIIDTGVLDVVISYQAVGGVYSNVASEINALLDEYLDGRTPSDTVGQILGAPVQTLPAHHIQNIADFKQAGEVNNLLDGIRKAIMLGDTGAFGAVYEHIDNVFKDAQSDLNEIKNYFETKYAEAERRFVRRNGTVIITDEDANPSTYTDGKWQRLPNVFLYGTTKNNEVGQTVDVAEGTGLVARKTNFFVRNDEGDGIIRVINANKTAINEGESVTFTLVTVGLPSGSKLEYTLAGIDIDDLANGSLTGEFTTNASGIATLVVNTKRDFKTEGTEILKCYLTNFPGVYDSVIVNDTSKTPTYRVVLGANTIGNIPLTTINEGANFYISVITTDVDAGTKLYLTYGGLATADDFVGALPTFVTIGSDGIGYVLIQVKEDFLTEGSETLLVNVGTTTDSADIKVSGSIAINDTSKTKTYNTKWSASSTGTDNISSANEGDTVYFVISTENVPQGTILNLTWSGITADDLVDPIPASITIYNNLAIVPVTIRNDNKTEGAETLKITVLDGVVPVSSASLVINDTSREPTYGIRFSTNSAGTDSIVSANEGDTIYAIIETTNVVNNTVLQINYSGMSSADFLEPPASSATIIGNMAALRIVIKADFTTEGAEVLTLNALLSGVLKASRSLTVADTSVSISGSITFSKTSNVTGVITEVNEDESIVYILYNTVDIPNGTTLGISFEGLEKEDLIATFPTTITLNNNQASLNFKVAKDWTTEGDQFFLAKLLLPNGAIIQNTLAIRDSSKTPVIDKLIYSTAIDGSEPVTSIGEDSTVYLIFETTNIPNGTILPIAWSGTANDADFSTVRPSSVVINNNKAYATLSIKGDYVNEGNETCIATITLPGNNGTRTANLTIVDTHKVQTVSVSYNTLPDGSGSNVTSVNEGSTVYAILIGTNVIDNQEIVLAWSGNTTDLSSALPNRVAMVGNKASVTITVTADLTREDLAESITITATTPSGATGSANLVINDTSKGYAVATWRTGTSVASPEIPVSGIEEGQNAVLHIQTFGIPTNEGLTYSWSGTNITSDDFNPQPSGVMSTSGSAGYTIFNIKRDYVTEGTETLNVTVRDAKGNELVTTSVKILDTSMTPVFTAMFATDPGGVNTFTSVDEPTTGIKNIYAVVKTTNMFDGDVVQFVFSGDADNNDFSGTPISTPVNVIINNNIGYYNLKLLADNADG